MIWPLALNALRRRPIRTFLTSLGIAVAVGSMVIFLSLGEGLRQAFVNQIGNIGPDLQVSFGDFNTSMSFTTLPELSLSYLDDLNQNADQYGIIKAVPFMYHFRAGFSASTSFVFQGSPPEQDLAEIFIGFEILEGRSLSAADEQAKLQ